MGLSIGGFLPLSLIDYPGVPSAVVFTNGCNLRCPYCYNKKLALGTAPRIPEEEIKERLLALKGKVQGVVISGGEPSLQPDLGDFCAWCKNEGFKVKVDTNGSSLAILDILDTGAIDYTALDLKHLFMHPPKKMNVRELTFDCVLASIRFDGPGELRCTCVRPYIDELSLEALLDYLYKEDDTPITLWLQRCNINGNILNSDFFDEGKGKPWTQEEINNFVAKFGDKYNVFAR